MKVTRLNLRKVINAKKDLEISILPKDINGASLKDPSCCVAARALSRQEGHEARVHLSRLYLKKNGGNTWLRYMVPADLRTEVISFDKGGSFAAGTYTLKAMPKSKSTGKKQGSKTDHSLRKNAKPRKKPHYVQDVRTGPANGV